MFCRKQLSELNEARSRFAADGIQLVAVSSDPPDETKEYADEAGIELQLLSDPNMQVISTYGLVQKDKQNAIPATYVLGKNRSIHWRYLGENVMDRVDIDQLIEIAKQAPK